MSRSPLENHFERRHQQGPIHHIPGYAPWIEPVDNQMIPIEEHLLPGLRIACFTSFAGGVGKTTLIAKRAVRWILGHGAKDLALVASDTVRIGAQDQMHALGQLLGVPVHVPERFEALRSKILAHLAARETFVQDAFVGADPAHRRSVRVTTETAWASLFADNLFLRPSPAQPPAPPTRP